MHDYNTVDLDGINASGPIGMYGCERNVSVHRIQSTVFCIAKGS